MGQLETFIYLMRYSIFIKRGICESLYSHNTTFTHLTARRAAQDTRENNDQNMRVECYYYFPSGQYTNNDISI